jgi:hypothetical protein
VPEGFTIDRAVPLGRHPLLAVFPGLDALETAARQVPDAAERRRLHRSTLVEIVDGDVWMYVAPHHAPGWARRRWKPVESPDADCIVIGEEHLRESPELTLFLDIYHELCHVLQRKDGRELFPEGMSYVERSTEVDAYRFVVDEARRFGVSDEVLRDYLRVEWIDDEEFVQLLDAVGVPRPG